MKHSLLKTTLLILGIGSTLSLHAQTSSILIQSGEQINGTSSNPAVLNYIYNVVQNNNGQVALRGYATETASRTNVLTFTNKSVTAVTNQVPVTNTVVTAVTNQVPVTNTIVMAHTNQVSSTNGFAGVTNTVNITYTTNVVVTLSKRISYSTNSVVSERNVVTFTTNQAISGVNRISYSTNTVVSERNSITYTTNISVNTTNIVTSSNSSYVGIWLSDTNDQLNLTIRTGQQPGNSNPPILGFTDPVLNNTGGLAFIGYTPVTNAVTGTNGVSSNTITASTGVYTCTPGSSIPTLVASTGSPAPGTSGNFTSFNNLALPDTGGVIFTGMVGTNQGVWVQNSDGSVHLIVQNGQSISVGGTNKTVSSFNLMNNAYPGVTSAYSQTTGVITYQAYFTDGTSAAVQVSR